VTTSEQTWRVTRQSLELGSYACPRNVRRSKSRRVDDRASDDDATTKCRLVRHARTHARPTYARQSHIRVTQWYFFTANIWHRETTSRSTVAEEKPFSLCGSSAQCALSLKRLSAGPGFNPQTRQNKLFQDYWRACSEINFSDMQEGLTVSSIICDR